MEVDAFPIGSVRLPVACLSVIVPSNVPAILHGGNHERTVYGRAGIRQEAIAMMNSVHNGAYRICSLTLDVDCELLLAADGTELPLRAKTFALLRLLVHNAGRTISKEEIMGSVWPDLFVTENNINQCVHEIRRAFGAGAKHILRTRSRRGYLLDASVVAVLSRPGLVRVGMEPDATPKSQPVKKKQIGNQSTKEGMGADLAAGLDPARGAA